MRATQPMTKAHLSRTRLRFEISDLAAYRPNVWLDSSDFNRFSEFNELAAISNLIRSFICAGHRRRLESCQGSPPDRHYQSALKIFGRTDSPKPIREATTPPKSRVEQTAMSPGQEKNR